MRLILSLIKDPMKRKPGGAGEGSEAAKSILNRTKVPKNILLFMNKMWSVSQNVV